MRRGVPRYVAQATPQFDADSAVAASALAKSARSQEDYYGEVGDCGKGPFMDGN